MKNFFFTIFGIAIMIVFAGLVFIAVSGRQSASTTYSIPVDVQKNIISLTENEAGLVFESPVLGLHIVFPRGWSLQAGSSASQAVLLNAAAAANHSDAEMLRGMKVEVVALSGFQDARLNEIAQVVTQDQTELSRETLTVQGQDVLMVKAKKETFTFYTVLKNGSKVIRLTGYPGSQEDENALWTAYKNIMRTLKLL